MNVLLALLQKSTDYNQLLKAVEAKQAVAVSGLSQAPRSHVLAAAHEQSGSPLVAVCQDELPGGKREDVGLGDQPGAALRGKMLTEQEIAVAMQHKDFGARLSKVAHRRGHAGAENLARVVEAVVAGPGLKEVAEDEKLAGSACRASQVVDEALRRRRRLRRKVQVRNEMDQSRSGPSGLPTVSRFRRAR